MTWTQLELPLDMDAQKEHDQGMNDTIDHEPEDADADWRVLDEEYWLRLAEEDDEFWADERQPDLPDRYGDR